MQNFKQDGSSSKDPKKKASDVATSLEKGNFKRRGRNKVRGLCLAHVAEAICIYFAFQFDSSSVVPVGCAKNSTCRGQDSRNVCCQGVSHSTQHARANARCSSVQDALGYRETTLPTSVVQLKQQDGQAQRRNDDRYELRSPATLPSSNAPRRRSNYRIVRGAY